MLRFPHRLTAVAAVGVALALGFSVNAAATDAPKAPRTESEHDALVTPLAITPRPETLFVSVTPCRIVDTRAAVGDLSSGETRDPYVSGTTGFAPQGGTTGGCGVPTGANAVSATVTAVNPSAAGYVRAWPTGGSEPNATILNYARNSIGTGGTLPIKSGAGPSLTVNNYGGPTHLVIDVTGYYLPQMQAYISPSGTVLDQSGRLASVTKTTTGVYGLTWDRDISSCTGQATSDFGARSVSVYTSGTTSTVYMYDMAGTATDYYFNVVITC